MLSGFDKDAKLIIQLPDDLEVNRVAGLFLMIVLTPCDC